MQTNVCLSGDMHTYVCLSGGFCFSENLTCFFFLKHPFWDFPFSLITNEMPLCNQVSRYFRKVFSKYQCGFRECLSVLYCLIYLIEKWTKFIDNGITFAVLLTILSKSLDCCTHYCYTRLLWFQLATHNIGTLFFAEPEANNKDKLSL